MNRSLLLAAISLILCSSACKEASPVEVPQGDRITDTPIVEVPREVKEAEPKEVEVVDLTGEVDLFIVVAGAYSSKQRAQKKARSLRKLGFSNADVVKRSGSKLYSAVVERFDSEASAEAFSKKIKTNNKIKSYVYMVGE